jgi:hypothetical protein
MTPRRKGKWSDWLNVIRNKSNGDEEQGQGTRGPKIYFYLFIIYLWCIQRLC